MILILYFHLKLTPGPKMLGSPENATHGTFRDLTQNDCLETVVTFSISVFGTCRRLRSTFPCHKIPSANLCVFFSLAQLFR